jgi:S1-C subfamily serine protease
MSRRFTFVQTLAIVSLVATTAAAQENVYKKGLKSTVWIVQPVGGTSFRSGSGTLIDAQKRYILTNYHVVRDKAEVSVFFPAFDAKGNLIPEREKYDPRVAGIPGKVKFTEPSKDLALIELSSIPRGTPALKLAKDSPSPGDKIHSIGSPGVSGALFAYTDGSVKAVYQKKMRAQSKPNDPDAFLIDAKIIETSSATNKGDSGGPLMNDKAELVGVTQGMLVGGDDVRAISYFVDVSEVRGVLKNHKITLSTPTGPAVAADTTKPDKPEKPAATTTAAATTADREKSARAALNAAGLYEGKKDKIKEVYLDVIARYPGTKAADEAKTLLDKLK